MRVDILTILPQMVADALTHSVVGRALAAGIAQVNVVDIRDFAGDRHRTTDDTPCGGGGGMLMKPEPIARALRSLSGQSLPHRVILTDPQGERFTQAAARELADCPHAIIICGRYEGVDERVRLSMVTHAYSIGDYVLTGGELPALVMVDAAVRLLPGALGWSEAPERDTFTEPLLDYPTYTRPREFEGQSVPQVLLEGNHADIEAWRLRQQLDRTRRLRPDLWARFTPSTDELRLLAG